MRLCCYRESQTWKGEIMGKRLEKQGEFVATDDGGKQYRITVFKEMLIRMILMAIKYWIPERSSC